MLNLHCRRAAAALLALILPAAALADTKAVYQTAGGKDSMMIFVKGPLVRWEADGLSQEQRYLLYDSQRGIVMIVDDGRKEIMEINPETVRQQRERMQSQMAPMMKQLQEQLKNLPPEQRRMIEKQMSGMMQPPAGAAASSYTTRQIGTGRVLGIPCTRHAILRSGKAMHEVCIASPDAASVPAGDYRTMRKMFDTMRDMASAAGAGSISMPESLDGVPVEMRNTADGSVHTLKSLSSDTLPAEPFKLPAYKTVTFSGVPGRK